MKIMFISYWSVREPLTSSTILPYLQILEDDERIKEVVLVTVEHPTDGDVPDMSHLRKTLHMPVEFDPRLPASLGKAHLFLTLPGRLARIVRERKIDLIDSKASLAGALAYKVSRRSGVPFMVESYEPHSSYMAECGEWRRTSPYYCYAKYYERVQAMYARYIITVTHNYRAHLIDQGLDPERVKVIPSITDLEKFTLDEGSRESMRQQLGVDDRTVGIYVGKFGGLYYDELSFKIFERIYKAFDGKFFFILLSPMPADQLRAHFKSVGIPEEAYWIGLSPHEEVPKYLNAADMAFCTVKYTAFGAYQSPVKNGEYWACGLPILMTDKISDDHRIIGSVGHGGALFDPSLKDLDRAIEQIKTELQVPGHRARNRELADQHRSSEIAKRVYREVFDPGNFK